MGIHRYNAKVFGVSLTSGQFDQVKNALGLAMVKVGFSENSENYEFLTPKNLRDQLIEFGSMAHHENQVCPPDDCDMLLGFIFSVRNSPSVSKEELISSFEAVVRPILVEAGLSKKLQPMLYEFPYTG